MTVKSIVLVLALLALAITPVLAAPDGPLDCLIEPLVTVSVASPVDGVLETINVDRGSLVKKGDVIARLESSVERVNVELARAHAEVESPMKGNQVRFDFGVRRFLRTDDLFKKELVPLKELDEAETQKVLAEVGIVEATENKKISTVELERAETLLALRTVRSPVNGVVVERTLSPGEFTKQGAIVKLAQIDPLRVEVIVPVPLMGRIHVGMRGQVTLEAPGSERVNGKVTVVDRVADAGSGTFGVRLEVPNPDYRLSSGLRCKVRFLD